MSFVSLHIGPFSHIRNSYVIKDADAATFIAAGSFADNDVKKVIDDIFLYFKLIGEYSKIALARLYIAESTNNTTALAQCGLNMVNPSIYIPTFTNNPTANFSGVNYNGINQHMKCGFNPSTEIKWGLNSATFMNYSYLPTNNSLMFGQRNTSIATNRNVWLQSMGITNVTMANGVNDSTGGMVFSPTAQNTSGFHAACRIANNSTKYYFWKSNSMTQTGVLTYGIPNMDTVFGGRTLDGGTTIQYVAEQRHEFDLFASGIAPSQILTMENYINNNFQSQLDLIFNLTGTNARKRY